MNGIYKYYYIDIKVRLVGDFFPGTPVSSTNKTDLHDIAEILLKVALNTINLTLEVISKETYLDMIH
jgi:hypothetical protein